MTTIPIGQQMEDALQTHYRQAASGIGLLADGVAKNRALDSLMESFHWLTQALANEQGDTHELETNPTAGSG